MCKLWFDRLSDFESLSVRICWSLYVAKWLYCNPVAQLTDPSKPFSLADIWSLAECGNFSWRMKWGLNYRKAWILSKCNGNWFVQKYFFQTNLIFQHITNYLSNGHPVKFLSKFCPSTSFWLLQTPGSSWWTSSLCKNKLNVGPSVLRAPAEQTKVATIFITKL